MLRLATRIACVLLLTGTALADYPADREEAMKLVRAGKHEQALAQLVALADAAADPLQKSDALSQASACAQALKQSQQAMDLAKQIPLPALSRLVQMRVLSGDRAYPALLAQFKDEDLSKWPEDQAGEAHYLRGLSYHKLRQGAAAEQELAQAVRLMGEGLTRSQAGLTRAENLQILLKDLDGARQAYAWLQQIEARRDRFGWLYFTAVIGEAGILRQQGQFDDALAVLNRVDVETRSPGYWTAQLRVAHAELLLARGQKEQARTMLRQALEASNQDFQQAAIQKQLDQLAATP